MEIILVACFKCERSGFFAFVNGPYKRFITLCIQWRWLVLSSFVGLLLISVSLITANHVRMVPNPKVPHDFPSIKIEMNDNVNCQDGGGYENNHYSNYRLIQGKHELEKINRQIVHIKRNLMGFE